MRPILIKEFTEKIEKAQAKGATHIIVKPGEILFVQEQEQKEEPKQKVFVNKDDNKALSSLYNHFNVGDNCIVIDGSYMLDENGTRVSGIDFFTGNIHELLTVKETNKPFPTDAKEGSPLRYINNCRIEGADGKSYYCSKINIIRFDVEK